jgi:hypothetical protein
MSKVEVNQVTQQCGTTLTVGGGACKTAVVDATTVTLGRCGGTVSLASGATQSGFGRTGTVDWDTSNIKTATFAGVNGNGYFANTTGGAFNLTLPASPTAGDIIAVKDYANTFDTNNLTVDRNGKPLDGETHNLVLAVEGQSVSLVYVDGTKGWLVIQDSDTTNVPKYVSATGGCISFSGDYKIHKYTGSGCFSVNCAGNAAGSNVVDYLVVAGGGSGALDNGGGGGAGGFRESTPSPAAWTGSPITKSGGGLPVSAISYPVIIGGASTAAPNTPPTTTPVGSEGGFPGNPSSALCITSAGGGGASHGGTSGCVSVMSGGSGGGAGQNSTEPAKGIGNTPPVSPAQGKDGGYQPNPAGGGGGGGGATACGPGCTSPGGTNGGAGATTCISGGPVAYAGGGGGGGGQPGATPGGAGGTGGGGAGGPNADAGTAGTINTGGGGGGAGQGGPLGASGGSGIVILRYKYQ